jgi:Zinc finger, C3HC4 type (RING finger)/Galactose oxidase, central domain/Kelch motif
LAIDTTAAATTVFQRQHISHFFFSLRVLIFSTRQSKKLKLLFFYFIACQLLKKFAHFFCFGLQKKTKEMLSMSPKKARRKKENKAKKGLSSPKILSRRSKNQKEKEREKEKEKEREKSEESGEALACSSSTLSLSSSSSSSSSASSSCNFAQHSSKDHENRSESVNASLLSQWREIRWKSLHCSGVAPSPRWGHRSAAIGERLYVFGGTGVKLSGDLFECNTTTGVWRRLDTGGSAPPGRFMHEMVAVGGNRLLVFGGRGNAGHKLNDLRVYDAAKRRWVKAGGDGDKCPSSRAGHSMNVARLPRHAGDEEVLFLFGGHGTRKKCCADTYLLELDAMRWRKMSSKGDVPHGRVGHAAAVVGGTRVYVFGGFDGHTRYFNDLHVFDLATLRWSAVAARGPAPEARSGHAMIAVGTLLLVVGGCSGAQFLDSMHVFDTLAERWLPQAHAAGDTFQPRFNHVLTAIGRRVFAFGGTGSGRLFGDLLSFTAPGDVEGSSSAQSSYASTAAAAAASTTPLNVSVGEERVLSHSASSSSASTSMSPSPSPISSPAAVRRSGSGTMSAAAASMTQASVDLVPLYMHALSTLKEKQAECECVRAERDNVVAALDSERARSEKLRAELADAHAEAIGSQETIVALRASHAKTKKQLAAEQEQLALATSSNADLSAQLARLNEELRETRNANDSLGDRMARMRVEVLQLRVNAQSAGAHRSSSSSVAAGDEHATSMRPSSSARLIAQTRSRSSSSSSTSSSSRSPPTNRNSLLPSQDLAELDIESASLAELERLEQFYQNRLDRVARARAVRLRDELDALRKEKRELRARSRCAVCIDAEINVVLLPCKHRCLCSACAGALKKCPLCREMIDERLTVY